MACNTSLALAAPGVMECVFLMLLFVPVDRSLCQHIISGSLCLWPDMMPWSGGSGSYVYVYEGMNVHMYA